VPLTKNKLVFVDQIFAKRKINHYLHEIMINSERECVPIDLPLTISFLLSPLRHIFGFICNNARRSCNCSNSSTGTNVCPEYRKSNNIRKKLMWISGKCIVVSPSLRWQGVSSSIVLKKKKNKEINHMQSSVPLNMLTYAWRKKLFRK